MRTNQADLVVVGAGPAGLSCAVTAAELGAHVVLIDSGHRAGGQFWRHGNRYSASARGEGHHSWKTFVDLRCRLDQAMDSGSVRYIPRTQVWMVDGQDGNFTVRTTPASRAGSQVTNAEPTIFAKRLALCVGAYDRQLPVPGWDLPGVMAAGGVQGFIKTNGFAPGSRVVVGGTGPFLMSVAASVARTDAEVSAVCEANSPTKWIPYLHRAVAAPSKAIEGAEYAALFARHRIPYRTRTMVTRILGTDHVEAVETAKLDRTGRILVGTTREISCDLVALGWGFTPQLELPLALGAETRVDVDGSLVCRTDAQGRTSVEGLVVAGETTGVGGAALAVSEGRAAGYAVTGKPAPKRTKRTIARQRRFATGMHQAYPIPIGWQEPLSDNDLVCRCEEVSAGEIATAAAELEAHDARSAKSFTRAGMGWCQGRECGFAVTCLNTANPQFPDADTLRSTQKRHIATPVPLEIVSSMETPTTDPEGR